jgi:hypothetical protein
VNIVRGENDDDEREIMFEVDAGSQRIHGVLGTQYYDRRTAESRYPQCESHERVYAGWMTLWTVRNRNQPL